MKPHSVYICQQCNYQSPSFYGKCPQCGEWNSLVETIQETAAGNGESRVNIALELMKLSEVKTQKVARISTGYGEFDRVLGGGIVPGEIVLISGDPGIGKSTLLLQTAIEVAGRKGLVSLGTGSAEKSSRKNLEQSSLKVQPFGSVLYITGEESAMQVKLRADRISKKTDNLYIMATTAVEAAVEASNKVKPSLLIIDSIQTLTTDRMTGAAGSIGQVRECAQVLQRLAKTTHVPIFLVGHVNKEGNIAGPKVLEHLVDAVLSLEGDGMHTFRLLRSVKNRFGSTFEVGVFEMGEAGMIEVSNPSQIFLADRIGKRAGSVVCSTLAGGRPILAEIQALCSPTVFGVPTRRVTGLDFGRVQIIIAALARAAKLTLGNSDVYVNVAGGLKIEEPAADLAAALAIASSATSKPVGDKVCALGEVGLLGELRMVGNIKARISEARRLGFTEFITPEKFRTLEEAVRYALRGEK